MKSINRMHLPKYIEDIVAYWFELNPRVQGYILKQTDYYNGVAGIVRCIEQETPDLKVQSGETLFARADCRGEPAEGKVFWEGHSQLSDIYLISLSLGTPLHT